MFSKKFAILALVAMISTSVFPATIYAAVHSPGTNIITSDGTVWMIMPDGTRRAYTSGGAFLTYGFNSFASVIPASSEDTALPTGAFIPPQDGTIFCATETKGTDVQGECSLVTAGTKAAFTSEAVFRGLGFSFSNAYYGDSSFLTKSANIDSETEAHRAGVLINNNGTIQLVGESGLLGIPDMSTLQGWGYSLNNVVPANDADKALSQTGVMDTRTPGQLSPTAKPNTGGSSSSSQTVRTGYGESVSATEFKGWFYDSTGQNASATVVYENVSNTSRTFSQTVSRTITRTDAATWVKANFNSNLSITQPLGFNINPSAAITTSGTYRIKRFSLTVSGTAIELGTAAKNSFTVTASTATPPPASSGGGGGGGGGSSPPAPNPPPPPVNPPPPPPAPNPPPPAANNLPAGTFDGLKNGTTLYGWSYDPDIPNASNAVQVFVNGPPDEGGTLVSSGMTSVSRGDVNGAFGITGDHGFEFTVPAQYQDGHGRLYYAYGIDLNDSSRSTHLAGSPKLLTVSASTPPPPPPPDPGPPAPPTSGIPPAGPQVGTSSVLEFYGPFTNWTNVKTAYGAVGNGVADDTAAIQAALNASQASTSLGQGTGGPRVLYFPAGTYRITTTLTLTSAIYVNLIGEDPDTTILKWDGANNGTLFRTNGVAYSKFSRLTFDGNNKARIAFDQNKSNSSSNYFDTGNEYSEAVFKNAGYGIRAGASDFGAAESYVVRCKFINNSVAAISTKNFNALDWWIWESYFENNNIGLTNNVEGGGAGNFSVYNSVFKNSIFADASIGNTEMHILRNNYSINSKQFYHSTWPGQNGSMTAITGNVILDTSDAAAIQRNDWGPAVINDNVIRSRAVNTGAAITSTNGDVLTVGNTINTSMSITGGRSTSFDNTTVARSAINYAEPTLPFKSPKVNRQVFEVAAKTGAAIQSAINSAAALCGQKPVVHIPATTDGSAYHVTSTITVPANCDIQIIGDGGMTRLDWGGPEGSSQNIFRLQGPSKATIRDIRIYSFNKANGILVENADQVGSRIYAEGTLSTLSTTGYHIENLNNTYVDMSGAQHSDNNEGLKVSGGGAGAGRTNFVSGASSSNNLSYVQTSGGKLIVKDIWYETSNGSKFGFLKLNGNGSFAMDNMRVALPRNGTPPAMDISNFTGIAGFTNVNLDDRYVINNSSGQILVYGGMGRQEDYFITSSSPNSAIKSPRWYNPQLGTDTSNDEGSPTTNFIRDAIALSRSTPMPSPYYSVPAGATDVKLYRVYSEKNITGFYFKN